MILTFSGSSTANWLIPTCFSFQVRRKSYAPIPITIAIISISSSPLASQEQPALFVELLSLLPQSLPFSKMIRRSCVPLAQDTSEAFRLARRTWSFTFRLKAPWAQQPWPKQTTTSHDFLISQKKMMYCHCLTRLPPRKNPHPQVLRVYRMFEV